MEEEQYYIYESLDGKYPSSKEVTFVFSHYFRWIGYIEDLEPRVFDAYKMVFIGLMTRSELEGYIKGR